jgi:hypothetical protein
MYYNSFKSLYYGYNYILKLYLYCNYYNFCIILLMHCVHKLIKIKMFNKCKNKILFSELIVLWLKYISH